MSDGTGRLPGLLADPDALKRTEEGRLFGADLLRALGLDAGFEVAAAEPPGGRPELLHRCGDRPREDPGEHEADEDHGEADEREREPARADAGLDLAERRLKDWRARAKN